MPARGLNVFVNIGAKLAPSLNSSATAIERRFAQMNRHLRIQAAETKLAYREMLGAMKPIAALAIAGGLTAGFKGIVGEGAEYQHQIVMMRNAGRSAQQMASAIAAANRTIIDVPTSTLNGNLRMLQETTLAFGGIEHAIENLQFNTRMGAMLKSVMGPDFDEIGGFNQLVRALEIRGGKLSAKDYQRQAGLLYRAMAVSGGTVNPENILGFMQQAGVASRGYNERFLTSVAPSLIQEFGGERAGTMATAMFNQFMGRVPVGGKAVTAEWKRLGLITGPMGGNLSVSGWQPGALKDNALAMANPLEWIEKTLFPAMRSHGINTNDKNAMLLQAQKMFGRETGKRLASTLFDPAQLARIHADQALYDKALGPDKAYGEALRTDPKMALAATAASLKNIETALGKSLFNPTVVQAIVGVARGFNALADAFGRYPTIARAVTGLMGLGAVGAVLKLFDVSLKFVLSPLKGLWKLLFMAGPRKIGILGWIFRGLAKLARFVGPLLWRALTTLGPIALRGLMAIGPWLLRGLAMAFGLLSNPVGWAILAASALALVFIYRKEIAKAWGGLVSWFTTTGWPKIRDTVNSIDWSAVGNNIAKAISWGFKNFTSIGFFGSMLANDMAARAAKPILGRDGKPVAAKDPTTRPGLVGMRAAGGYIRRSNRPYLVGERGPELVTPGRSGYVHTARATQRMAAGGGGGFSIGNVIINGANDPDSTRRIVRDEFSRMMDRSAYLTD